MSEENHTPLPWVGFSDHGKCIAIMPAGRPGDVCSFNVKPSNADADLILRSVNALPALVKALEELHAMVWGECPSLLNEDSGGNAQLDMDIRAALASARSVK